MGEQEVLSCKSRSSCPNVFFLLAAGHFELFGLSRPMYFWFVPAHEVRKMSKNRRVSASTRPYYHILWECKQKTARKKHPSRFNYLLKSRKVIGCSGAIVQRLPQSAWPGRRPSRL
jgi:hypothetical protein